MVNSSTFDGILLHGGGSGGGITSSPRRLRLYSTFPESGLRGGEGAEFTASLR